MCGVNMEKKIRLGDVVFVRTIHDNNNYYKMTMLSLRQCQRHKRKKDITNEFVTYRKRITLLYLSSSAVFNL